MRHLHSAILLPSEESESRTPGRPSTYPGDASVYHSKRDITLEALGLVLPCPCDDATDKPENQADTLTAGDG
jgi:hypothetical protein